MQRATLYSIADGRVFERNSISRRIRYDTRAVVIQTTPKQYLVRSVISVRARADPTRPYKLT